jgi:hypothetical protein
MGINRIDAAIPSVAMDVLIHDAATHVNNVLVAG